MRLSRFGRITGGYVLLTVVGCIVLAVLSVLLDCGAKPVAWFCASHGMLNTIAQVIPATVVAIFVFALGATFVIAQIVVPSRGSRSIGELFSYRRVRWVLVGGLVLLGGSLLITLGPDGTDTSGPAGTGTSPPWSLELATVLVAATILYIGAATCLIVWTFLDQLSPRLFKERLTNPPRINPLGSRGWTSEELYRVLRVLRGWLRTVNRVGESRDLQFGLEGVHELVTAYAGEVWKEGSDGTRRSRLYDPPKSYEEARKAARTQIPLPPCGGEQPRQQGSGSSSTGNGPPWFADELGRALTRAVESGVRGNTLRRDLDRLLNLFEVGIREFAPCDTGRPVLADEVCTLIKHLTEVALGVRQCEDWQRDWFVAPALRLARIERHLEHVADHTAVCAAGRPDPDFSLARTALVGWLLAGDASSVSSPRPSAVRCKRRSWSKASRCSVRTGGSGASPSPARSGTRWNRSGMSKSSPAQHVTLACRSGSPRPGGRRWAGRGVRGQRPLVRADTVSATSCARRTRLLTVCRFETSMHPRCHASPRPTAGHGAGQQPTAVGTNATAEESWRIVEGFGLIHRLSRAISTDPSRSLTCDVQAGRASLDLTRKRTEVQLLPRPQTTLSRAFVDRRAR